VLQLLLQWDDPRWLDREAWRWGEVPLCLLIDGQIISYINLYGFTQDMVMK
jgi:hypothetical protein